MPRTRTYGLDVDTIAYAARVKAGSGVTILTEPLKQLNKFIVGIKKLGLWNSMVCWPMRSIHNAGTGTTVYSLGGLGTYNGTMTNGPTWGFNGVSFRTSSYINVPNTAVITSGSGSFSIGVIAKSLNSNTSDDSGRMLITKADIFNLNTNQFQLMARNTTSYNGLNLRLWAGTSFSTQQSTNLWNGVFKVIQAEATSGGPYRLRSSGIAASISSHTNTYNLQNDLNIRIGGNTYASATSWDGEIGFAFYSRTIGVMPLIETLLKQTIGTGLNMPY